MAGWPERITRDALGPALADVIPPPNGVSFLGAAVFTLAWWVLAGLARTSSRAWVATDGADVLGHGEAWYPNGDGPVPELTKNGTGDYDLEYESTAANEVNVAKALGLTYAKAYPQGSTNVNAVCSISGTTVTVKVFDADAGTPVDATVFVEVF